MYLKKLDFMIDAHISVTSLCLEFPQYQSQICSFDQFHKDVYHMELTKENYQKKIKQAERLKSCERRTKVDRLDGQWVRWSI